jgi:hypothetical protein
MGKQGYLPRANHFLEPLVVRFVAVAYIAHEFV